MEVVIKKNIPIKQLRDVEYGQVFYFVDGALTFDGNPFMKIQDEEGEDCMVDLTSGCAERIGELEMHYEVTVLSAKLILGE